MAVKLAQRRSLLQFVQHDDHERMVLDRSHDLLERQLIGLAPISKVHRWGIRALRFHFASNHNGQ